MTREAKDWTVLVSDKKQVLKRTVKNILYVLVIIRKEGAGAEVRFVHAGGSVKFLPVV